MGVLKTSDHVKINIKMPNPHQEPTAPTQDLKDIDILCTFKIKIESKNFYLGLLNTSDHIHIKIKIPNP